MTPQSHPPSPSPSDQPNRQEGTPRCRVCSGTGRIDPCIEGHPEITEECPDCGGTGNAKDSAQAVLATAPTPLDMSVIQDQPWYVHLQEPKEHATLPKLKYAVRSNKGHYQFYVATHFEAQGVVLMSQKIVELERQLTEANDLLDGHDERMKDLYWRKQYEEACISWGKRHEEWERAITHLTQRAALADRLLSSFDALAAELDKEADVSFRRRDKIEDCSNLNGKRRTRHEATGNSYQLVAANIRKIIARHRAATQRGTE